MWQTERCHGCKRNARFMTTCAHLPHSKNCWQPARIHREAHQRVSVHFNVANLSVLADVHRVGTNASEQQVCVQQNGARNEEKMYITQYART